MSETTVGFCGLGTMGAAMAANVARAGFPLTVWNRTAGRAALPLAAGASEVPTPAAVGRAAEVVVICVSDTPDVEAVLFGEDGLASGLAAGSLVVDCSTISPAASRTFGARLGEAGVGLVDAPVSGGSEGAQKGTLTIMVGGSDEDVARARPVLETMGSSITHMGPVGAGQTTKAVNQVILSGVYLGVAEGMVLAIKSGPGPGAGGLGPGRRRRRLVGPAEPIGSHDRRRVPTGLPDRAPPQGPRDRARAGARGRRRPARLRHSRPDRGWPRRPWPRGRRQLGPRSRHPRVERALAICRGARA